MRQHGRFRVARRYLALVVVALLAASLAVPASAGTTATTPTAPRTGPPPVGSARERARPQPLRESRLGTGGALPSQLLPSIPIPIEDISPSHSDLDDAGSVLGASGGRPWQGEPVPKNLGLGFVLGECLRRRARRAFGAFDRRYLGGIAAVAIPVAAAAGPGFAAAAVERLGL